MIYILIIFLTQYFQGNKSDIVVKISLSTKGLYHWKDVNIKNDLAFSI
jgi:hypothetical protein